MAKKCHHFDCAGFFRKKSATNAIFKLTRKCYSAPTGKEHIILNFLDFGNVFDTIFCNILT